MNEQQFIELMQKFDQLYYQVEFLCKCYPTLHNSIINRHSIIESDVGMKLEKVFQKLDKKINDFQMMECGRIEKLIPAPLSELLGTMQFIAKKFHRIEARLEKIESDRLKEFKLKVYVEDQSSPEIKEEDPHENLLNSLPDPFLIKLLAHRYGLRGPAKTVGQIASVLHISRENANLKIMKALRYCRHKDREHLVNALPKGKLRSAITGEEEF